MNIKVVKKVLHVGLHMHACKRNCTSSDEYNANKTESSTDARVMCRCTYIFNAVGYFF